MKISVLGSGSTGNSVLLVANGTRVLVDAGLSARETARRMSMLGEDPNSLDAILITHEHGDHAGGLRVLTKDRRVGKECRCWWSWDQCKKKNGEKMGARQGDRA